MGTGFAKKKKQAKAMQEQISQMQSQIANLEVTGSSGNGLVTVTLTGDHLMKSIHIKPECVDKDDVEGLQDLIQVAYNEASKKLDETTQSSLPPGMAGFF